MTVSVNQIALPIPIHPRLDVFLGYTGAKRYFVVPIQSNDQSGFELADFWNKETGNYPAYQSFIEHPAVAPFLQEYRARDKTIYRLLIDRQELRAFIVTESDLLSYQKREQGFIHQLSHRLKGLLRSRHKKDPAQTPTAPSWEEMKDWLDQVDVDVRKVNPDFSSELEFWDTELAMKGLYADWMVYRTDPEQQQKIYPWEIQPYIQDLISRGDTTPKVLDVGSGPVSMLAYGAHQGWFELISADPLANEYHKVLKKYHFEQQLVLVKCFGEELTNHFGTDSFDLVWMYNALDHSQSPQIVFEEMVNILRPGGYLIIQGQSREGTAANWSGLHHHDLYVAPGGKLMCETRHNPSSSSMPARCLSDGYPLELVESSKPSTEVHQWIRIVWRKSE